VNGSMGSKDRTRPRSLGSRLRLAVCACSLVVLLTGCGLTGPSRTVEDYFPFAVGNEWYWVRASSLDDSMAAGITDIRGRDGMTFYRFAYASDTSFVLWFVHWNGELRAYATPPEDTASRDYLLLLKEPLDLGAAWQSPVYRNDTFRIIDADVTLSVPAGTFKHCIQVGDHVGPYYYAPGVGWVVQGDTANGYVLVRYVTK